MTARQSFRALVVAAAGVAALVGLAVQRLVEAMDVAIPPGYALTWCGWLLGSFFGLGGLDGRGALVLTGLVLAALVAGSVATIRTLWITHHAVRRLTMRTTVPPGYVEALASELGIADRLVLSTSPEVYSFCFGLWRPQICVSVGLVQALTPGELRAVLAHERHHLSERDPLKALCASVLAAVTFPVPLVWALRQAYLIARELDADRAAMAAVGRLALAGALHKVLTHPRAVSLSHGVAVGPFSATGARLNQITQPESRCYPRIGLDVGFVSLGVTVLLAGMLAPMGSPALKAAPSPSPFAPVMCHTMMYGADACSGDMGPAACCYAESPDSSLSQPPHLESHARQR